MLRKRLSLAPALLAVAILSACGAEEQGSGGPVGTKAPGAVPVQDGEVAARLDAAGEERFVCEIGDVVVAVTGPGNSYYRSATGTEGEGLEIRTVEYVSYARYTGALEADASSERRRIVEELDGAWGSWGQPDTILLEELPGTPSGCLSWAGIEAGTIRGAQRDGDTIRFNVDSPDGQDGGMPAPVRGELEVGGENTTATLRITDSAGTILVSVSAGEAAQDLLLELVRSGGDGAPEPVREITQEQYFALVGG